MKNRFFKCHCCGNYFPFECSHQIETVSRGKARYLCDDCFSHNGEKVIDEMHKAKAHGTTIQISFTGYGCDNVELLKSEVYGFSIIDGNNGNGSIIAESPEYKSLCGIKSVMRTAEKFMQIDVVSAYIHNDFVDPSKTEWQYFADSVSELPIDEFEVLYECPVSVYVEAGGMINVNVRYTDPSKAFWFINLGKDLIESYARVAVKQRPKKKSVEDAIQDAVNSVYDSYANGTAHCMSTKRNKYI